MGEVFDAGAVAAGLGSAGSVSAGSVAAGERYAEVVRRPALSAGIYRLAAGERDPQSPHTEDEIYVVVSGRAVLRCSGGDLPVGPGTVAFVPAGEVHRFHTITEDLVVAVVFGPAEGSAVPSG